jgi:hypothetical protein
VTPNPADCFTACWRHPVRGSLHAMLPRGHGIVKGSGIRNDPVSAVHRFALQCARDDGWKPFNGIW